MPRTSALERVINRARDRRTDLAEHCDLCGTTVLQRHRHLLDTDHGQVLCSCQACSLLFVQEAASRGHYRLVPERRVRLQDVSTEELGVPVGLAFFVPRDDGRVIAHYPSPLGSTEWEVDQETWHRVVERHPELGGLAPEVEALLVNVARDLRHHWIVPVDDCFRLIAIVRREWRGMSGGGRVWPAIDTFFDELSER